MSAPTIHAPLAQWAQVQPDASALTDGQISITFSQLHQRVEQGARDLTARRAPSTVLVDTGRSAAERIVEFLSIVSSGRCAAVGDKDWLPAVREAVQVLLPTDSADVCEPDADAVFYAGFTSGSTGIPKGYCRSHRSWVESFEICLKTFGPDGARCVLVPGRDSHSLFLFGILLGLWTGAGAVLQNVFSAARALDTLRSGVAPCLVAVPSQLLLMLDLARHRALPPVDAVRLVLISGARWNRSRTAELNALFPNARVIEFYGASETSFIAWRDAAEDAPAMSVGRPFANVEVQIRQGLIYLRSPMVFSGYLTGASNTSKLGEIYDTTAAVREGEWISVRDQGYLDPQGWLCLHGRENRMIVTQGKNLFPEAVEAVLETHPAIASASVLGQDDALRGQQLVVVLKLQAAALDSPPTALELRHWCNTRLERWQQPRRWLVCEDWPMTSSGKTDHRTIAQAVQSVEAAHAVPALQDVQAIPTAQAPTSWLRNLH
jgi:acyl-CoA synthetase (AMP-forming)/AMP-acid ligase II